MFIGLTKPKGFENVPLIQDVLTKDKDKPIIDLLIAINALGRPFAGPPGIPQDRLKILREAFKKACHDPDAIALAEKSRRPINYVDGEQASVFAKNILALPPDVLTQVKKGFGME